MAKRKLSPKRPRKKNPMAVALGVRGGRARARNLTKAEHVALARKAAQARWARERAKNELAKRNPREEGAE